MFSNQARLKTCLLFLIWDTFRWRGRTVPLVRGRRFAQLENRLVELGEEVGSGTVIGTVGMSGRYATGPHLHLERWTSEDDDAAQPVDPVETAGLVLFAGGSH